MKKTCLIQHLILGATHIPNPLEDLHNSFKYKGKDWWEKNTGFSCLTHLSFWNPLICFSTLSVVQYFTVDFICTYQMNRYPFDVQKCNGTLEPKKNSDFFVKLVPKYLSYNGPTDLMKYQLATNISFILTDNVKIQ